MELTTTKKKVISIIVSVLIFVGVCGAIVYGCSAVTQDANVQETNKPDWFKTLDIEGYDSFNEWADAIADQKENFRFSVEDLMALSDYLTDEEKQEIDTMKQAIEQDTTLAAINEKNNRLAELKEIGTSRIPPEPVYSGTAAYSGSGNNFKRDGIWYDNNYEYTWYSSNVLHHYRTNEWTPDENGYYRDSEGRVCVASDDYALGTELETEKFGTVIVTDNGVGKSGRLDVYTNF